MKRITFTFLALVMAWYMGGCGGSGNNQPSIPPTGTPAGNTTLTGTNGTYYLRGTNCGETVNSFRVTEINSTRANITIIDHGTDSTAGNSDVLTGCVLTNVAGAPAIDCEPAGSTCAGVLITSSEAASSVSSQLLINVQNGDLLMACNDDSADGVCSASYRRAAN